MFCTGVLNDIQIKISSRNIWVPTLLFALCLHICIKNVEKLEHFNANFII